MTGDNSLVLTTAGSVVMSSVLLQYLKAAGWFPWLTRETERANRIVAIVLAGISSLGIHFAYDPTAGTLAITGLVPHVLAHDLWRWFVQFALQHGFYKTAVVPVELAVKNGQLLEQLVGYLKDLAAAEREPVPPPK